MFCVYFGSVSQPSKLREAFELFASKGAEPHLPLSEAWLEMFPHLTRDERRALGVARTRAMYLNDRENFDLVCDTVRRRLF
jgi:hypothetical protein